MRPGLRRLYATTPVWQRFMCSLRRDPLESMEPQTNSLVLVEELQRFLHDCFQRLGVPVKKIRCISDLLLAADYRGIHGCGINRLDFHIGDIQNGYVDINAEPTIISETATSAHVDGNHAMGVFVGNYCMDLAVEKASKTGLGFVVAKRSHHIGMAAWYAFRALSKGYIGLVMSNSSPMLMPPGARSSNVGANCLAFGAVGNDSHFMLDMATSVKDMGAIEWAYLLGEFIPPTWAADRYGNATDFASSAFHGQRLFPAGGHKGYCLAVMIDMLCGVMSGASYAKRISRWWANPNDRRPNLGLVMLALDPSIFVPDFKERLDDYNWRIKTSCLADENNPIMLPGEKEKNHMRYVDDLAAMPLPHFLLIKLKVIADFMSIRPVRLAFVSCERSNVLNEP